MLKTKTLLRAAFALLLTCGALTLHPAIAADSPDTLYTNDFEKAPEGDPPGDIVVLAGKFAIKNIDGNKVLEVPGDPVDGFGFLFGPDDQLLLGVSAKIYASSTGKRYPEFGVGIADTNGYRAWVMPGTHELQILKGDEVKAKVPYTWKSASWTTVRLQLRKNADAGYTVEAKCWESGQDEPKAWMVSFVETEDPPKGRPSAWGTPYSSMPIRFDDLKVMKTSP
jgi:hypothetical protein